MNKKNWLPRHYYSISRAARELDCEEDDLYHLAESGEINLSIKLHMQLFSLIIKDESDSGLGLDVFRSQNTTYYLDDKYDSSVLMYGGRDDLHTYEYGRDIYIATLSGLWAIGSNVICNILKNGQAITSTFYPDNYVDILNNKKMLISTTSVASFYNLPSVKKQKSMHSASFNDIEISISDLLISRRTFLKIDDFLRGEAPSLLTLPFEKDNFENPEVTKIDLRGRHFEANREVMLMALGYSFFNYGEEIKGKRGKYTTDAHAEATLNHWAAISGGYDEPSKEQLLRLLRDTRKIPADRKYAGKPKTRI